MRIDSKFVIASHCLHLSFVNNHDVIRSLQVALLLANHISLIEEDSVLVQIVKSLFFSESVNLDQVNLVIVLGKLDCLFQSEFVSENLRIYFRSSELVLLHLLSRGKSSGLRLGNEALFGLSISVDIGNELVVYQIVCILLNSLNWLWVNLAILVNSIQLSLIAKVEVDFLEFFHFVANQFLVILVTVYNVHLLNSIASNAVSLRIKKTLASRSNSVDHLVFVNVLRGLVSLDTYLELLSVFAVVSAD